MEAVNASDWVSTISPKNGFEKTRVSDTFLRTFS
jgi:hypothetical protein